MIEPPPLASAPTPRIDSIGPDTGVGYDDPGGPDPIVDPEIADSYEDAIDFIDEWEGGGSKKAQQNDWNAFGSAAHNELSAFNESGEAFSSLTLTQIVFDGDDFASPLTQNYLAIENNFI